MDYLQLVTVAFGGGTVGVLIRAIFSRNKDSADVAYTLTRSARDWIQDLERRLDSLEAENATMRTELRELRQAHTMSEIRENALVRYIKVLRDAISRIDPNHTIPKPPPEVYDTVFKGL